VIRLLTLPFRLVAASTRVGWRAGRLVGPSRAFFFGLGFVTGVLLTSPTARKVAFGAAIRTGDAIADARRDEPVAAVPVDGPVLAAE
jgi:hypothetical protein